MAQDLDTYVLEIIKQGNLFTMSLFQRQELASTIKRYSELAISSPQINSLCQEVTSILNKSYRSSAPKTDLIQQLKKTGQSLWDNLLTEQIKKRLISSEIKELVLSLDEGLISIPWELLYDGSEFFCLKFNLGRVIRSKEQSYHIQYRGVTSILKMLILANPTDDLKSAYHEGIFIKNQLDRKRDQVKINFKSTNIDTLYLKKNLRDYDIVHFAGHCDYESGDPSNTGWKLTDGKFTTRDILALSENLSLPNLIFSNACHSARACDGFMDSDYQEKTYSLASAFLFSGVRHYVGSTWQLEDNISLLFAKEFYSHLIRGKSIGECIRKSRLSLMNEPNTSSLSWANYILYGDPSFVLFNTAELKSEAKDLIKKLAVYRKYIKRLFSAVLAASICIFLYILFTEKNPSIYFLFLKSKRLLREGRNEEAVIFSERIIRDDPLFLSAYPLIADAYERLGDKENCLKYYFDFAIYSQKKHDNKNLVSAYIQIGWTYQMFGEYTKALDFYNKAMDLSKDNKDKLNESTVLRKLAVWHIDKEDYNKALELLMKALEIDRGKANDYNHRYNLACDYFDIGLVFSDKDDSAAAVEFYKKSKVLFEKLKLGNELSDYYFNLGELYLLEKRYNDTLEYYLKGLKIDQACGNKPSIASDYNMLGELYMEMDNLTEGEKFLLKSVSLCEEIKLLPELASVYYNLGVLNKRKRQINKAREYFRMAQELYRKMGLPAYQEIRQEFSQENTR